MGDTYGTDWDSHVVTKRNSALRAFSSHRSLASALAFAGIEPGRQPDVRQLRISLRRARRAGYLRPTDRIRLLLSVHRPALFGDEVETFALLRRSRREALVIYEFAGTGAASVALLRPGTDRAIRSWISGELDRQGWTPAQLTSADVMNSAPQVLPRTFFVRLLGDAASRGGWRPEDSGRWSEDWFAEHYQEVR